MAIIGLERASQTPAGVAGDGASLLSGGDSIGRYLLFQSTADDITPGDTNGAQDVFLKDYFTGVTTRVSTDSSGGQLSNTSSGVNISVAAMSPDGSKIVFISNAPELFPAGTPASPQLFLKTLSTGVVTPLSTSASGAFADAAVGFPRFSPDGTKVLFSSSATNLVTGDTNGISDVFLKDISTGAITRVSTGSHGEQAAAVYPFDTSSVTNINAISPDGTKVLFDSTASNLVAGDTNNSMDVFLKNLVTGAVTLVSTDASGAQGNGASYRASFSPDGKQVVFQSLATNLVANDTNSASDIFVKTLATGAIARVSTNASGAQGVDSANLAGYGSRAASFSPDGKSVAFVSAATNLVPDDTNNAIDAFTKNIVTGAVTRVSTQVGGAQVATGVSATAVSNLPGPLFAPDGRHVAFVSDSPDLVVGDTNGATDVFLATLTPPPTISLSPTISEAFVAGPGGRGQVVGFTFAVERTGDSSGLSAAPYTVAGSGPHPADAAYFGGALPSGTVVFGPGQTTAIIIVNTAGISDDEGFTVTLSTPLNGVLGTASESVARGEAPSTTPPVVTPTGPSVTPPSTQAHLDVQAARLTLGASGDAPPAATITGADGSAVANPLYVQAQAEQAIAADLDAGRISAQDAQTALYHLVDGTVSVANLDYAFFTGATPTATGLAYLVHSASNPSDLNDAYYTQFSTENRYINLAVDLATAGTASAFVQAYGGLSLTDAATQAYTKVFGFAPADGKIDAILNELVPDGLGGQETRAQYLAGLGGDGPNGIATKAAVAAFLLADSVKEGFGAYQQANLHFLADLAHGQPAYNVDLLAAYASPPGLIGVMPDPHTS